ncbi:MAG: hypothetical protein GX787_04425 [Tissierellia bacterium]|nr:hypothetical protein [Tissierellia bacterium]
MKKTIYSILSLLFVLLFWGCAQEDILQDETQITEDGSVLVKFSAEIPAYNTIQTRANGGVNSMYLLVFDENGIFITLEKANLKDQTDIGGVFTANLLSSTNKRTVHFICNYDELRGVQMAGSNEAGIVAQLSTDKTTFWARRELEDGISATSFSSNPIALLRNQAKISVVNEVNDENKFVINGFAIHNRPEKGTIAPFSSSGKFDIGAINEPSGLKLVPAKESDINSTEPEKLLFERRNRGASDITTVIIKAEYYDKPYFYKIDLIYKDNNNTIQSYNIERNYHYVVRINNVMAAGFDSFSDALEGASNNNAALDPIIEKYPIISDGESKLEVEKTLIIATKPGENISVGAKFYPDVDSNVFNNSEVSVTLVEDEGDPSINSLQYNKVTGTITAKASNKVGANLVSLIQVRKGSLARTIRVVLRTPFSFDPIRINDRNPGVINDIQNFPTQLRFLIPTDFPEELFPLPIKIYTQGLYPKESGLKLEVSNSGEMYYIYNATETGEQIIDFKTNKSGNKETVRLVADYFVDGAIYYDVLRYKGTIKYNNNNVPKGAVVIPSTGKIEVAANGEYTYTPPVGSSDNTSVTLTYYELTNGNTSGGIQQSFENGYRITTTVGALNNKTINLLLNHYRITGRMQYSGLNYNIPVGATLDVSDNVSSYRILETGRYELITDGIFNNSDNITIGYRGLLGYYQASKNIGTLRTDQFYRLR